MPILKITLEVSLEELKALYWLMSNLKHILKLTDSEAQEVFLSFLQSEKRNLQSLEELYEKIEPIVER